MSEQYIDLHVHSTVSDGTVPPEALPALAVKTHLAAIALTDHDTVEGVPAFLQAAQGLPLEAISGIELSGWYDNRVEIHIVGLYVDPAAPVLARIAQRRKAARLERNRAMAQKLTEIGLPLTYEELCREASGSIITRAHYARLMIRKGYVKDRDEAFNKYISPGLPGYVAQKLLGPEECVKAIVEAGGVPILAHPTLYHLSPDELRTLCRRLMPLGLMGIEARYSMYSEAQQKQMTALGNELGLLLSGGSDFHGDNKPGNLLGYGKGNLRVPYEFLEKIKAACGK